MVSFNDKVALISRAGDTRGPLGVAKEVNYRLVKRPNCREYPAYGTIGMLSVLLKLLFSMHGYSVCIHANGFRLSLIVYVISKLNRSNRYYCVLHGISAIEKQYRPIMERDIKLEAFIFRHFQNIVCVSNFQKNKLYALYGKRDHVHVIHNGAVASNVFGQHKADSLALHEPVCITTGGFEQRKGVDLALEVLKELSLFGCTPKLIVCGRDTKETGSNREQCEQMAHHHGIELIYQGEVRDKQKLQGLYEQSHFYMGLSRFDTFNVSVLEGAAAGCVPVISKTCGAYELFDEASSVICDFQDADWLVKTAYKMRMLVEENNYNNYSERARRLASSNSWEEVANNYWRILTNE